MMRNRSIRISDDDLARIAKIKAQLTGGSQLTESAVIRVLIQFGCQFAETALKVEAAAK